MSSLEGARQRRRASQTVTMNPFAAGSQISVAVLRPFSSRLGLLQGCFALPLRPREIRDDLVRRSQALDGPDVT